MPRSNKSGTSVMSPEDRALLRVHRDPASYSLRRLSKRAQTLILASGAASPMSVAQQLEAMGEILPEHYPHHTGRSGWHPAAVAYGLAEIQG
jgi:hypothetical protein